MGDPKVPPIGPRIRAERARREVTIRALARVIGVSPSLISQIETGKSQPSVSTLYGITSTLGLSLEDLFDTSDADETAEPPAADQALRYLRSDRVKGVGPHVSPDERELLTLESGVTWERLGLVPNHHVEFLLVTYQPGDHIPVTRSTKTIPLGVWVSGATRDDVIRTLDEIRRTAVIELAGQLES